MLGSHLRLSHNVFHFSNIYLTSPSVVLSRNLALFKYQSFGHAYQLHSQKPLALHSLKSKTMPRQVNGDVDSVEENARAPSKLILCFDGTGNKYEGKPSDTNIVKLYQKFDRDTPNQYHYYQREFQLEIYGRIPSFIMILTNPHNLSWNWYLLRRRIFTERRYTWEVHALVISNSGRRIGNDL